MSGKKTALLNSRIQHLYLPEACIAADSNPCDMPPSVASGEDHEDDPEPVAHNFY